MDGNGRWAEGRGLPRVEGHRRGAKSVRDVVRAGRELGLSALTLYAFSAENWQRPVEEVATLMQLLRDYVIDERAEIMAHDIRVAAIGAVDRLPGYVREPLDALVSDSSGNTGMTLCLALSYGGRDAIVDACRTLAAEVAHGRLAPEVIGEAHVASALSTADLPPLDLIVRTSGEQRLSNFFLWEAAYAELYFTEALWPDFTRDELIAALECYGRRERRFGRTGAQVRRAT